ncbi:MAG: 5-formyltetrahydrofolate cyclo-ligase [Bacteroidetes bacterium]|nr:5-formyltetrahydrofolate cyclo-ligase [Bacteroidota bacterium]MBI3482048.1 5-formyltetrahydrofolate cyclo-ligase [Bacteroidota bacterium]
MTKKKIRSEYLKLRLKLSEEKYSNLNQKLCANFFSEVDLSTVHTLHTFLPIHSKKEPNTWLIIEKLKKDFPVVRISIPKVENNRLVNFYFEGESQLGKNQWGILEPISGEKTPTDKIDLVIVPLLAFDKNSNRVGYGKGFYDRFLKECRMDCKKIGLSFFEPIDELIQVDQYDIPLDVIITPSQGSH